MGYADDFYIKQNIIGYTGMPNDRPTVYFATVFSDQLLGKRIFAFGRITQDHPDPDNIGRNKVRYARDYAIYNLPSDSGEYAAEFYNREIRHRSRNPFVLLQKDDLRIDLLAPVIDVFQQRKLK